jgi:prepilin-type N-terminal cleavage/methylation domain-containing protein
MEKKNGFTLIETLVVIFLMGIIMVGGGGLFFNIMKGASKAEVGKEVKQNGNYALAIMERMIKNSRGVENCISIDNDSLTIKNIDDGSTTFFLEDLEDSDKIASFSGTSTLYLTGDNVTVSSLKFTCVSEPLDSPDVKDIRRVEISFSLKPTSGSKEAPETYAEINFQTSVSLRNFEE